MKEGCFFDKVCPCTEGQSGYKRKMFDIITSDEREVMLGYLCLLLICFRIFLTHFSGSFMSSRFAHIPKPGSFLLRADAPLF